MSHQRLSTIFGRSTRSWSMRRTLPAKNLTKRVSLWSRLRSQRSLISDFVIWLNSSDGSKLVWIDCIPKCSRKNNAAGFPRDFALADRHIWCVRFLQRVQTNVCKGWQGYTPKVCIKSLQGLVFWLWNCATVKGPPIDGVQKLDMVDVLEIVCFKFGSSVFLSLIWVVTELQTCRATMPSFFTTLCAHEENNVKESKQCKHFFQISQIALPGKCSQLFPAQVMPQTNLGHCNEISSKTLPVV